MTTATLVRSFHSHAVGRETNAITAFLSILLNKPKLTRPRLKEDVLAMPFFANRSTSQRTQLSIVKVANGHGERISLEIPCQFYSLRRLKCPLLSKTTRRKLSHLQPQYSRLPRQILKLCVAARHLASSGWSYFTFRRMLKRRYLSGTWTGRAPAGFVDR